MSVGRTPCRRSKTGTPAAARSCLMDEGKSARFSMISPRLGRCEYARPARTSLGSVIGFLTIPLFPALVRGMAGLGMPLLLLPNLAAVLLGMVLIGVGTFFAQATATGFVSRAATADRGSASGIYLACYFPGGLVGTAILGQIFDRIGWSACVVGIALSLGVAAVLAFRLKTATDN